MIFAILRAAAPSPQYDSQAAGDRLSGPYRDGQGAVQEKEIDERRIGPSRLLKLYHASEGRGIYVSSAPGTVVLYNQAFPAADHDLRGRARATESPTIGACEEAALTGPAPAWLAFSEVVRAAHP